MLKHTPHHQTCKPSVASGCRSRFKSDFASVCPRCQWSHSSAFLHRRGGAVIIVVLALLSLMIFLGVFFFEFTQEEQLAAQNYAVTNQFLDPEPYFEEALSQLIIGPSSTRTMSPLAAGVPGEDDFTAPIPTGISYGTPGTPYSLLAHVIGRMQRTPNGVLPTDVIPHNGHGISVQFVDNDSDGVFGPGDYARFDMNGDGTIDAALDPTDASNLGVPQFGINFSRPAQLDPANDAFSQANTADALSPFQPDVDYTYPDINNLFLAYERVDPTTGRRILVPSFHRPDLFPSMRDSGFGDLYTDSTTTRLVMRPHREHRYADNTPGNRSDNVRRYLVNSSGTQAESGDTSRVIFPFPFQVDSDSDGVYNEMGIYSNVSNTEVGYDLDVDLTGDGKPDGIWIDSGYDLIDLPDGRQMVPMFSFHVIDADSLININSAGNLQGVLVNEVDYDSGMPFSVSNTGASASEINMLRALTGEPDSYPLSDMTARQRVFAEHLRIYSSLDISQPITALTMANMELAFVLGGRIQSRSSARLSGRYGEQKLIGTGTSPAPGITGFDDDLDDTPDSARYQGGAQRTMSMYDPHGSSSVDVVIPYASHPIAPIGTGSSTVISSGAKAGQRVVSAVVAGSPVVSAQYPDSTTPTTPATVSPNSGWQAPQSGAVGTAVPVVSAAYPYPGTLFPSGTNGMTDEEDETRLRNPDRIYDDIFRPEENMSFQLSDADHQRMGGITRAEMLAPFNFKYAHDSQDIRKRFTTDSWDLSELTYVPWRYVSGFTETSEWVSGSGRKFFPPVFSTVLPGVLDGTDPFRPEVRALLATENTSWTNAPNSSRRESYDFATAYGTTPPGLQDDTPLWRQRLNLNKLLVGFDADGYPIYRDLMPHPDIVAMEYQNTGTSMPAITIPSMIHDHYAAIPASAALSNILSSPSTEAERAQTATAQEWWARYDRQRMARDIYTLLYLVGAPNTEYPVTTNNYSTNPERVREIAQFAVNYVDALDRDDVITKFEYDDNLSNGWDASPTKHVYGIERASLSFSEVQFLQTLPQSSDYASTLHNDLTDIHQYLHMELRNSSPFTVNLTQGWRISRVIRGTGTRDCSVEFKTKGFGTASPTPKLVDAGANLLIGTHDGTVVNASSVSVTSDFYADIAGSASLESVLPSSSNTIANNTVTPNPQSDLDLGVNGMTAPYDHENYYDFYLSGDAASTYTGSKLVERIQPPAMGTLTPVQVQFDLILERRQNLHGIETTPNTAVSSSMGEWIEVDRFHVNSDDMDTSTQFAQFDPAADTQAGVIAALQTLNSVERRQSFDPVQVNHTATASINHTISADSGTKHAANSALTAISLTEFSLWQPHFDRDLTSAYELLSVPLYGNWPLSELSTPGSTNDGYATNTFYKEIHGGTQFNLAPGSNGSGSGKMTGDFTAGIRFNFPNGVPGAPYQGWNPYNYQNCWYRLLDFVTVPRRADQQSEEILTGPNNESGSTKPVLRVPGKINLNTLRDEYVAAALLDDEAHLDYGTGTTDKLDSTRNWYQELLQSRDGIDYFADQAGLPDLTIPNSISSRPFRTASTVDPYVIANPNSDNGVEFGLLRSANGRGLNPTRAPFSSLLSGPTAPTDFTSTLWGTAPSTPTSDWQGLFEAADNTSGSYGDIDHHTRNRILAKIANNSTTKSHVFFVWTAVGYFEAHRESTNNRVQIGARMNDIPIHRRFSVVDMSKIDEAYNPSVNTFEASKFIIFQKRLR